MTPQGVVTVFVNPACNQAPGRASAQRQFIALGSPAADGAEQRAAVLLPQRGRNDDSRSGVRAVCGLIRWFRKLDLLYLVPMPTIRAYPIPVLIENSLVGLGSRIAIARKARALTQADLARLSDVGTSTVASLEAGYHGVSVGNFLKVLKALDLLAQVDDWLPPATDPAVVLFATRRLGGRDGG